MKNTDPVNMANAWELADDMLPGGFDLKFKTKREHRYDRNQESQGAICLGGLTTTRERVCPTIGDLKEFIKDFVEEAVRRAGPIPFMTATGIDEQTNIEDIVRWGQLNLELAFLYSHRWQGKAKRYPELDWILEQAKEVPRAALHVCGNKGRKQLIAGELDVSPFDRIQINGTIRVPDLKEVCQRYPDKTIILQYQGPGDDFFLTYDVVDNLALLIDASGGNGILPDSWADLESIHPVGFAGGLDHENMEEQVRAIREVAKEGWWVDLESGLRDEEWFSKELLRWSHQAFERGLR